MTAKKMLGLFVMLCAALVTACSSTASESELPPAAAASEGQEVASDVTQASDRVQQTLDAMAAWNARDFDAALATTSPDVQWQVVGTDPLQGGEAIKGYWSVIAKGFPDLKITPRRVIETQDQVVVQYVALGTHGGEFMGVPATQKPVGSESVMVVRYTGDKATNFLIAQNQANFLAQVGAMPGQTLPLPAAQTAAPEIVRGAPNAANEQTVRSWYETYAKDTGYAACETTSCTPDFIYHTMADGKSFGMGAELKGFMAANDAAFPDLSFSVDQLSSAGEYLVAVISAKGTHQGDLGPIKATGKSVATQSVVVGRLVGGKTQEMWGYDNAMQLLGQLGLLPAAPTSAAAPAAP